MGLLLSQALAPFYGSAHLPASVNWCALVLSGVVACAVARAADATTRVCLAAYAAVVAQVLWVSDGFDLPSNEHLAVELSAHLSSTVIFIPWWALFSAWSALSLGWLTHRGADRVLTALFPWVGRRFAISLGAMCGSTVALFGVRAVLGYATGSPSLID